MPDPSNREALSDLTERPDPAKIDELVDYARAGGLEPHDEGNGMGLIEHWIAYDTRPMGYSPIIVKEKWRAESFRSDAAWRVEGPFVPAEQLAGAVATLDRLEHLLSSPGDMSPDEIRAEGRRLIAETRGTTDETLAPEEGR